MVEPVSRFASSHFQSIKSELHSIHVDAIIAEATTAIVVVSILLFIGGPTIFLTTCARDSEFVNYLIDDVFLCTLETEIG